MFGFIIESILPFIRSVIRARKEELEFRNSRFNLFKFLNFLMIVTFIYTTLTLAGTTIELAHKYMNIEKALKVLEEKCIKNNIP